MLIAGFLLPLKGLVAGESPKLLSEPKDTTVVFGAMLNLGVEAAGTAPLRYQWYLKNSRITGGTNAIYSINTTLSDANGAYQVVVSNTYGSVTSRVATAYVIGIPLVSAEPRDQSVPLCGTAPRFEVALYSPLSRYSTWYQWYKDGLPIPGGTSNVFTITNPGFADAGGYQAVVGNYCGSVTSRLAVLKVLPAYETTVLAGGYSVAGTNDGSALEARFAAPSGLTLDTEGNLYVADRGNSTVRKVDSEGRVTTICGIPRARLYQDGAFGVGKLSSPQSLRLTSSGDMLIADGSRIRRLTAQGVLSTLSGRGSGFQDGAAKDALFSSEIHLAPDEAGNILIADRYNHVIRKLGADGITTTIAGTPRTSGTNDGTGTAARFDNPAGITLDGDGNVLVADSGSRTIRRIDSSGRVTTVAGSPGTEGFSDGVGTNALFRTPSDMTWDTTGSLLILDPGNACIRKLDSDSFVSRLMGLSQCSGIAVGPDGNLFLTAQGIDAILVARPRYGFVPSIAKGPVSRTVQEGRGTTFVASVAGSPPLSLRWLRDGTPIPDATNAVLGIPSSTLADAGTYILVVTNELGTASTTNATLTVTPLARPPNDTFENRMRIEGEFAVTPTVSLANATTEVGEPSHLGVQYPMTLWWSWTAPRDGMATVAIAPTYHCPSSIAVYTGNDITALAVVASNSPPSVAQNAAAHFSAFGGTEYQIAAAGGDIALIFLSVSMEAPSAPSLKQDPASVTNQAGMAVELTGIATGNPPPAYRWYKDGVLIPGATNATLTIPNLQQPDAGTYQLAAANDQGTALSSEASVTVLETAPLILTQPKSDTVTAGYPAELSIHVIGTGPLSLQWYKDGIAYPGANSERLTFDGTRPSDAGHYSAVVSGPLGVASSEEAALSVLPNTPLYEWTTLAGAPNMAGSVDGLGPQARFNKPSGIFVTQEGDLLVADYLGGCVRRVSKDGMVRTLTDAAGQPLVFHRAKDVAQDAAGNTFVLAGYLYRVTSAGISGRVTSGTTTWGLALDKNSQPYVADVRSINSFHPDGSYYPLLKIPSDGVGIAFDRDGAILLTMPWLYVVARGNPLDGSIAIVAGRANQWGSTDGQGTNALFVHPNSVSQDASGNLFVADEGASTIRKITPDGIVTTVGGRYGSEGHANGIGSQAHFSSPRRVVVGPSGCLFVVDTDNHLIRKGTPILSAEASLSAVANGDNVTLIWSAKHEGFELEEREALSENGAWKPALGKVYRTESGFSYSAETKSSARFFRLKQP